MTQTQQTAITQPILQALQGLRKTDEALQATVNQLHLALNVSCCLLVRPGAGQVTISQATLKTDLFADTHCLQSHFQLQLTEGDAVVCDRLDTILSPEIQQFIQTSEIGATVIVPLVCHQSYLGEISLYQCNRPRQWTAAELDLVQLAAKYMAIALYQTELHKRLEQAEQTEIALRESEERKQTEIALRRREQEFRALVEHSPDVIARFDRDLRHLYINPAVTQATGLLPDCLIGRTNREVWGSQNTIAMWERSLRDVFSTGQSKTIEFEFSTPVGTKYHQSRLVPEFDSQGKVEFVLTVCRDVSALKQVESALRQSEEQFRQLAENIGEVFWITSSNRSQLIYVSPAYEMIWGRSCESLYANSQTWIESIHPEDREHVANLVQEQELQDWETEYRVVRPDQTVRWIRDRAFPIRDELGEVYRFAGIAEDITLRKQAEQESKLLQTMTQAILESEDFHSALQVALQKVCEATTWAIGEAWVPNAEKSVLECSPVWYSKVEGLTEFRTISREFVFPLGVGLPGRVWAAKYPEWCRDVSTEASNVYLRAKLALNAGLKAALGIPIVANDRVLAVLVFYMFEAREEDQRLIELISASAELGLFIQRKQAEGEIRKSLLKERELNRLKSDFISMVSHEFRTPLSSIVLSAELLETYGQRCTEEKRQIYFRRIQNSTQRITQLLENVLFLGQSESGRLEFNPQLVNLGHFCQNLVEELQPDEGSQHSIAYISQGNGEQVYMDEKLLQHIFGNLLCNAIKYSPKGGVIRFELLTQVEEAVFKVQDTGIGIPLVDQLKLFEPFHRATNVEKIGGTGLGLSIVKQCVDLHRGQITVQSEVGVGTTFTVRLPLGQSVGR
ncbi:PAS domain S-box protein [Leptolyngbya sp. FACHB-671]|uniref:PAS domain S-box protein n=1 Tax=Leptolyngbya sp. FACHB-671 TaxID=2692812 RepID=UPI0016878226|nr:PAS domain S-box protein [Leptolyngbya sp. FACHB-671]MBD2071416.1 PAS domain S-box protein [Leptolyngbya sp. FACHB-671]